VARAEANLLAKFHIDLSNRLATVLHNVTDRQDRQQSDSIGRTVLQTVAQKLNLTQQKHTFTDQNK